ncbi:MAG: hypothetical protein ACREAC_19455, partial [Blastocatellia bacterium]
MPEHLSETDAGRYARKEMAADELLAVDEHIEGCSICLRLLGNFANIAASAKALRSELSVAATEPYHLTYENLESYVRKTADEVEIEIIRDHLDNCPSCSAERDVLASFRSEFEAELREQLLTSDSLRERRKHRVQFSFKVRLLQVAAIVAIAVVSAAVTRWVVQNDSDRVMTQLRDLNRENDLLRHEVEQARILSQGLQARLAEGQERGSRTAAVELRDGSGIVYDVSGNLSAPASMPVSYKKLMEHSLAAGRVQLPPWVRDLRGKKSVLMGVPDSSDSFKLETPLGAATLSDRPEFRWKKLEGGSDYVVSVYDEEFNQVAKSSPLTANQWRPGKALKRGRIYLWQVTVTKDGREVMAPAPPEPEARFKVIDSVAASELEDAERDYPDAH